LVPLAGGAVPERRKRGQRRVSGMIEADCAGHFRAGRIAQRRQKTGLFQQNTLKKAYLCTKSGHLDGYNAVSAKSRTLISARNYYFTVSVSKFTVYNSLFTVSGCARADPIFYLIWALMRGKIRNIFRGAGFRALFLEGQGALGMEPVQPVRCGW